MLAYLRLRGFFDGERPATSVPAPAPESVCGEIPFAAAAAASKIPKQVMPSPSMVMRDLSILKRAGRLLGEPVYLFGETSRTISIISRSPRRRNGPARHTLSKVRVHNAP